MIRDRIVPLIIALLVALAGCGCASTGDRPEITYSTLPTREVQGVYPMEFAHVHATCQEVLRNALGFNSVNSTKDDTTGRGRIDATDADGASVRIETERSRNLESTSVRALAVEPGATEANAERAKAILQQIENSLWPAGT
jgi:hypothetical protein